MYFGIIPINDNINTLEKGKETMIKCFHKAAASKFDGAFTLYLFLLALLLVFFFILFILAASRC